jgi:lipoate---protein ligase
MGTIWRVVDTGLRPAAQNIALTRALLEARHADEIASTLRFMRFTPCALLGFGQSAAQALDLDHCRASGTAIQRRLTGGAASSAGPAQIGWELHLHAREAGGSDAQPLVRRVAHAIATAIGALGFDARFRAPHDLEVDGRRFGELVLLRDRNALLLQGSLFVDIDFAEMLRVLRTPFGAPTDGALAALTARMTSLKVLLGREPDPRLVRHNVIEALESEFDIELREADLTLSEEAYYQLALRAIDTPAWIELVARPASEVPIVRGVHKCGPRLLQAAVLYERASRTLREVCFSGDITMNPARLLPDLEAALRDVPLERLARRIEWFFASHPARANGFAPADWAAAVQLAVEQHVLTRNG